ncbi:hypothetical protein [Streptomyces decoyicus]
MPESMNVKTSELRASAHAADHLAGENDSEISGALKKTRTAADSLSAWTLGPQLDRTAADWEKGLKDLQSRIRKAAANLRDTANSVDRTDAHTAQSFQHPQGR